MPIWNYISNYWKCLQKGNPISQLAWDLTSTLLLLKFWADVPGGVVTTTIPLDSSCFYCYLKYSLHWGLLAHRLQRLIQRRLRAEQVWPFLKFFARKRIVVQVLIRYWSVLSLQNEFEAQQNQQKIVLVFSIFRTCSFLWNLFTGIFRAWIKPHPREPKPLEKFNCWLKRSYDPILCSLIKSEISCL